MSEFCIVGGGGHARVLLYGLQQLGHQVRGYTAPRDEGVSMAIPFLGTDDDFLDRCALFPEMAVLGLGKVTIGHQRLALLERYQACGIDFPVLYAQGAIVHGRVDSGAGSVVLDGAVVVTGSRLGRACIINTHATVDHDCVLGDDVHVASGATLSGGVIVGDRCMIGTGANLIHAVRICADSVIGAGATVIHDIIMPGTYVGTPARRIA
ncbi:UDP-perosamine 4-acetyltransferase [Modicisalibacter muralis]|uniref:UDP-perosamine 4-acetyltransferase n=1 Tax=Modicisalibacter muralis TaxID=119000 RepID=A0A1G9EVV0_9GAMM|nr:NeuD/PglB/VioB family sugar acetyltransferase [Halomonas muralis]SDK80115.1 UDP-perosamine 4-acetyltransferase [Halomonas muralis]